MGSRKLGRKQVEAGSQGPTARLATAKQGILNRQDALVPSSPSFRRTTTRFLLWQVAGDSPGYSRDAGRVSAPQGKAGENGQPGCCLCKSSLQETVGYAGGKLPAGVANDWVTRRSPVACLADLRVTLLMAASSLAPLVETSSRGGRRLPQLLACYGGSMYSLACRTPGIIPRDYCSLRDRGA